MSGTIEIERRTRRRYDTQIATTYQLDHVRKEHGYRAMILASRDGHMLAGSMSERLAPALARYTSRVGTAHITERRDLVQDFVDEHLGGEDFTLHVREFQLADASVFLGVVARSGEEVHPAMQRTISGIERIFLST